MRPLRRFQDLAREEDGQAIVLIATVLLGMLMFVGLAIDAGQLYVARRTAQEAADAGAYAAAVYIYQSGENPPTAAVQMAARDAAIHDVGRNGFSNGGDGGLQQVSVTIGPTSGDHIGDPRYVEVNVTVQVHTALVPQQSGLTSVHVRAVAGAVPLNNKYAIMALDRGSTDSAIYVGNTGSIHIDGAGILVNSTSPTAANNQVTTTPPPTATPNVTIANSAEGTKIAGSSTGYWPNAVAGSPPRPDPFAQYPPPSSTGLDTINVMPPVTTDPVTGKGTMTLRPGIYTIPVSVSGTVTATMLTGIYVIEYGMNGAGNIDFLSGPGGIFIYNTSPEYSGVTGSCAAVKLSGNSTTSLSPMTVGTYANMLFYQDRSCTQTFSIAGNGVLTAQGTIYVPNGQVQLDGNNAMLDGSQVVAKTVNVQSGHVQINFRTGSVANPILPRLAE